MDNHHCRLNRSQNMLCVAACMKHQLLHCTACLPCHSLFPRRWLVQSTNRCPVFYKFASVCKFTSFISSLAVNMACRQSQASVQALSQRPANGHAAWSGVRALLRRTVQLATFSHLPAFVAVDPNYVAFRELCRRSLRANALSTALAPVVACVCEPLLANFKKLACSGLPVWACCQPRARPSCMPAIERAAFSAQLMLTLVRNPPLLTCSCVSRRPAVPVCASFRHPGGCTSSGGYSFH